MYFTVANSQQRIKQAKLKSPKNPKTQEEIAAFKAKLKKKNITR